MKRLEEIEKRAQEIQSLLAGESEINMEEIQAELRALADEKKEIELRAARQQMAQDLTSGLITGKAIEADKEERKMNLETLSKEELLALPEYRTGYFKLLQGQKLTDAEQRTLTTASNSVGAAVPTQTMNMVIDKLRQTSVLFPLVNVFYISGNVSLIVANAKTAANWKAEGADGTPADDTVVSVSLAGNELIKLVQISAKASAMTVDALEAYIVAELGRQIGIAFENAILNGAGSGSDQPQGILTGISWTAGTNMINYASTVGYDNLLDGIALLPTLYHQNAKLIMSRKTLFGGVRKIKSTTGEPVFTLDSTQAFAGTIFGYPVVVDDYIADDVILFGDLNYYYMNIAQAPTIEVSREAAFVSGKLTYRGLVVADGKPALAEAFVKISKTGL
jgi:HK97 family phage major capsid protein